MLTIVFELSFTFFFSLTTLFMMRKVANRIGLVDKPNERKLHSGAVPLVGGISICISLLHFLFKTPDMLPNQVLFMGCIVVLTVMGAIDDKVDLNYKIRLLIQATISICMMIQANISLHTIGDAFGFGDINLGVFGDLVTILAVIGAINAFNMVDGIDGLLGGLSMITFSALGAILWLDRQFSLAYLCLVLVVIIVPYVLLNLGALGRKFKIFMGDAGSMLIGFTVIWLLLISSQNGAQAPLRPVTALWLIAVPLMDMAAIMIRRIRRGDSPFKPDREHLHHIFQRFGFNSVQTLICICGIAFAFAAFGIYGELIDIPAYVMFYLFVACFIGYTLLLSNIWRITTKYRQWKANL